MKRILSVAILVIIAMGVGACVGLPSQLRETPTATSGTEETLKAASTELLNIQVARLAYYADNAQWPESSYQLGKYVNGTPRQHYTFDTGYAWTLDIVGEARWPGIRWNRGTPGENGRDGWWSK